MRIRFDEQLTQMKNELSGMGALCEQAIDLAAKALLERDGTLAEEAIQVDREIDQAERDIETLCLKLLLRQQPVARDLRQISAALKMITDMERIGDQASDIAEITIHLDKAHAAMPGHVSDMAAAAIRMVNDSVDAYVRQDLALARAVIDYDDVVDNLFVQIREELIARIAAFPACGDKALDLLMIAKYLERIGDHATNIAEWVEFSILGHHPQDQFADL